MRPYVLALCGLLLLGLSGPAPALARLDPRLSWQTLETEHFLVLFHQHGAELAARAAVIAEEAHRRLAPALNWEPVEKTRLVLADVADLPNGMATPMPFNRIVVYLSPPLEQPLSITDREDWLRIVITHEYTHILQLDTVHRLPAVLHTLFGRWYFPNLFQPTWLIEGLATYEETLQTEGGRGRSSYTDMLLRMAVLENRFPVLSQAAVFPDSWPAGDLPYLFGVKFYQYLTDKYGADLPGRLSTVYGGRPLPYMVDSTALSVFGSTFKRDWLLWQRELRMDYQSRRQELLAAGLTPLQRLTFDGFQNLFPALSPDGSKIAYSSRSADRVASLMLADADGSHAQPLLRRMVVPAGAGLCWLADGRALLYSKIERDRFDNLTADLYRFDLGAGTETRLTEGLRSGSPDFSSTAGAIVVTAGRADGNRLALLDSDGGNLRYLTPADDPRQFFSPRWSPDGQTIAVGVKTREGVFAIQLLDRDGGLRATLPDGGADNGSPAWSSDGQTLFFRSDRDGIFNIYAYRLATGELFQVSNVLGGAFSPAATPDGQALLVASYSAAGFDLARMELVPERWRVLAPSDPQPVPATLLPPPALPPTASSPYNPWPDLRPRYWLPWVGSDDQGAQLGLLSSGTDAVDRHTWAASLLYGLESHHPAYSLLYQYDGLTPTLQLFASDKAVLFSDFFRSPAGNKEDFWERRRSFGLDLQFVSAGLWQRHMLVPGLRYQHFSGLDAPPAGFPAPSEGVLAGLRLAYRFSNAVEPGKAISPEDGRLLELAVAHDNRDFGGDYTQTKATLDWHEFTDLPWRPHHVLASRLFGGWASGDVLQQRAFQLGGDTPGDLPQGLDGEALALRGYPSNVLRGQRALLASLEYRWPVFNIERGVGNGPFFFRRLHAAAFAEGADAFDHGGATVDRVRTSAGAEARCDLDLGYLLPITLRLVLAKGFNRDGETQVYSAIWVKF